MNSNTFISYDKQNINVNMINNVKNILKNDFMYFLCFLANFLISLVFIYIF